MNFLPDNYGDQINLLHSLVIGPTLLYTGYKLNTNQPVEQPLKLIMLITGCAVVLYHGWRMMQAQQSGKSILEDRSYQINGLHFLFIGPLVGWVGYKLYNDRTVTDLEKTALLLLGVLAVLYHGYKLYKKYKVASSD